MEDRRLALLMRAAQAGDSESYEQLMHDVALIVRRSVRRQRSFFSTEDVEDLVQEVLLSVHVVRATYDSRRPFLPWLAAITRNRLVDDARRYARQPVEVVVEHLDVTFSKESAKMPLAIYGDPQMLREAVRSLPRGQRDAIEMLKLREMSLKEAAAASGTSVGALKVATHRAMQALRKKLTGA
jgi:RNA polymerase sigma factor (sigma-70 family)